MAWNARRVRELIDAALHEDRTVADATSRLTVAADQEAQAAVVAKQECVLAGLDLTPRVFAAYNALLPAGDRRPPGVVSHNREVFDGGRLAPGPAASARADRTSAGRASARTRPRPANTAAVSRSSASADTGRFTAADTSSGGYGRDPTVTTRTAASNRVSVSRAACTAAIAASMSCSAESWLTKPTAPNRAT